MKTIFLLLGSLLMFGSGIYAQKKQSIGVIQANFIADKMRDTLHLSPDQRGKVQAINTRLHEQKMMVMKSAENRDSIGMQIQLIENTRDVLYKEVLTEEQYMLYKKKKQFLISTR